MPLLFLSLFIGVPIAEIALFIRIGDRIGLGWTLVSIFATAAIGTVLVRWQGLQTMARARAAMQQNQLPVGELLDGVCILIAAALLLTPGFLTDAMGFLLLIPPLRQTLAGAVVGHLTRSGGFQLHTHGHTRSPIIDGEFEEINPDPGPEGRVPDPSSPWRRDGIEESDGPK